MNNNMYVNVIQDGEIKATWTNQHDIVMQLLNYLYQNRFNKTANFKIRGQKLKYTHDLSDTQNAEITIDTWYYTSQNLDGYGDFEKNITTLVFYNIPVKYGSIDTYTLLKLLNGGNNNV